MLSVDRASMPSLKRILLYFSLIMAALIVAFVPAPESRAGAAQRTFQITASSFEFYPAEITVNPGDLVTIELISSDVVHGLYLDGYGLQVTADPGQTETLTFKADRSGTFRFRCSVTCGDLHPFMIGKLHVGQNILLWRGFGFAFLALASLLVIGFRKFQPHSGEKVT